MWIHRTEDIGFHQSKISSLLLADAELNARVLPKSLLTLSSMSMKTIRNADFQPREVSLFDLNIDDSEILERPMEAELAPGHIRPIRITPRNTHMHVAAVDVSSIRIGETEHGLLWALRGTIVRKVNGSYVYLRCGPLAFHISNNMQETMHREISHLQVSPFELSFPLALRVVNHLRNTMERWLQRLLCSSNTGAIILLDGSLTAGTPDNPARNLREILEQARKNENTVLALSKETKLTIEGRRVTTLLDNFSFPCLIDIDDCVNSQFPRSPIKLMGRVYIAKLAANGFSFRLDIDREATESRGIDAVRDLIGADLVDQGYPETLRLAHILSSFTANEVIGIQRFITKTHGLRICPQINMHRQLFGPFGTSRESSG